MTHYLLAWSRNARTRACNMERARFARLRGDRRAVLCAWRGWGMHGTALVRAWAFGRAAGLQAAGGALQQWRAWTRAAATLLEASQLGDTLPWTRRRRQRALRRWRAAAAGVRQSACCRVQRLRGGLSMWRERAGARAAIRAALAGGAARGVRDNLQVALRRWLGVAARRGARGGAATRGAIAWRHREVAAAWRRWTERRQPPRAARFAVAAAATLVVPALRGGWVRWRARFIECTLAVRQRSRRGPSMHTTVHAIWTFKCVCMYVHMHMHMHMHMRTQLPRRAAGTRLVGPTDPPQRMSRRLCDCGRRARGLPTPPAAARLRTPTRGQAWMQMHVHTCTASLFAPHLSRLTLVPVPGPHRS